MNNKKICAMISPMVFLLGFFIIVHAEGVRIEQSTEPIEYNEPIPMPDDYRWGNDVQITSEDSIYEVELDIHRQTGNLFAVVLYPSSSSSSPHCAVYFSSNGGSSWSLGNSSVGTTFIKSMSATVLGNHLYVALTYGNYDVYLRRYRVTSGQVDSFSNGNYAITVFTTTPPDTIKEVALVSDQDFFDDYMNLFAITSTGKLRYFWSDTAGINWTESPATGVTNAKCGLDACTNEGYSQYYAFATYVSTDNHIQIDGFDYYGNRTGLVAPIGGPNSRFTSVGAYHDTVITVYEMSGSAVAYYIRYASSFNGGATWFLYNLTDTTTASCLPDVAARDNGGQGIAYAYGTSSNRRFRYTWRDYYGSWSTPVQFGDYQPPNNVKPAIEYLGNNRYGCVYVSYSPIYGAAYFDRSDWTGISEERNNAKINKMTISPNPSNGAINISYSNDKPGKVRISLYDASGRLVDDLINEIKPAGKHFLNLNNKKLPSGIYFIQFETLEETMTSTMTIIR